MAEKYLEEGPYNYALNNPVMYIDPYGNEVEMCCDGLKGFIVVIVDNLASMNIRSKYEGQDFENGVRAADVVSSIGGGISQSALKNGELDPNGVSNISVNLGPTVGFGKTKSTGYSFKASDGINSIKSLF